jgi:hypothetical protein
VAILGRRTVAAVVIALVTGGMALVLPGAAAAAPGGERTFTLSGDADDYLTQGQSYAYSTSGGDEVYATLRNAGYATIEVDAANGDGWHLDLYAPRGQQLQPGTYTGATDYPTRTAPGVALRGNGRGCGNSTGEFTITALTVESGRIAELAADFEVHCESGVPAARGHVEISAPLSPPLQLTVDTTAGAVDPTTGNVTLDGTLTCTEAVLVEVRGSVLQIPAGAPYPTYGSFNTYVDCVPGAPVAWDAVVPHSTDEPFQPGPADVSARASALDPADRARVEVEDEGLVTFTG